MFPFSFLISIAKSPFLCYYPKIPSFQGRLGVLCFGQLPRAFLSYVSIMAYSREYVNTFYKNI
nr:MAG TPA: hypothetical protein [Caudoviricetes sp.]